MQNQAVMNAPGLAQADYADISQLANVGKTAEDYQKTALQADIDRFNFEQNKPYQKLSAYLGAALIASLYACVACCVGPANACVKYGLPADK